MKKNCYLKIIFCGLFVLWTNSTIAQMQKSATKPTEFHVSVAGDDTHDGLSARSFRNISTASKITMPGDVITVRQLYNVA